MAIIGNIPYFQTTDIWITLAGCSFGVNWVCCSSSTLVAMRSVEKYNPGTLGSASSHALTACPQRCHLLVTKPSMLDPSSISSYLQSLKVPVKKYELPHADDKSLQERHLSVQVKKIICACFAKDATKVWNLETGK